MSGWLRRSTDPRGQALVEFALAIFVFILVLVGLFDLGRGVFNHNTLSQASREGARLGAVQANWIGTSPCSVPTCPATTAAFKANVVTAINQHVAGLGPVTSGQVKVYCGATAPADNNSWSGNDCSTGRTTGNLVTVRVTFTFVPVFGAPSIGMGSQTSMVIN